MNFSYHYKNNFLNFSKSLNSGDPYKGGPYKIILSVLTSVFFFIKNAYLNLQTQLPFVARGLSFSICGAIILGLIPKLRLPNVAHY